MQLTDVNWIVVVSYSVSNPAVGLRDWNRAIQSLSDSLMLGRTMSRQLAETSVVATTFTADMPLEVTGLCGRAGIVGNWSW